VLQDWVTQLPFMQQSVLISAIRNHDGFTKGHAVKPLVRWYRRCVVISAFDGRALDTPHHPGGGNYTGPSCDTPDPEVENWEDLMEPHVTAFLDCRDEMTLHYYGHFMHGAQIVGVHHYSVRIAAFWSMVYRRMVNALHLNPETDDAMNARLGDNVVGWKAREELPL
jgi:hypothetical protein